MTVDLKMILKSQSERNLTDFQRYKICKTKNKKEWAYRGHTRNLAGWEDLKICKGIPMLWKGIIYQCPTTKLQYSKPNQC